MSWCYPLKRGHINALFKHSAVSVCITARLLSFFNFLFLTSQQPFCAPDSAWAAAELLSSHAHFHVILTCQCEQNCQTLLKALNAMCNSFNIRLCRYPHHCCNGMLMPPCILRSCTRQLVIHLIYSTRPAVDQTAQRGCLWWPEYIAGHSAAPLILQIWVQGHVYFYHSPQGNRNKRNKQTNNNKKKNINNFSSLAMEFAWMWGKVWNCYNIYFILLLTRTSVDESLFLSPSEQSLPLFI